MAGKRRRRWVQQAKNEADLRYGAQHGALRALVGQARQDLKKDIRVANGMAAAGVAGARQERRSLKSIYDQAARGGAHAREDLDAAFGRAGVGADNPFALASQRESGAYRQRIATAAAEANREVSRDIRDAKLGRLFANTAARQRFYDTRRQIEQSARDLAGERGSFIASRVGELRSEAQDRRASQRQALIQQGIDPKTGQPLPGSKAAERASGKKFKPASRSEKKYFDSDYAIALDYAKEYKQGNTSRSSVHQFLTRGVPANAKEGTSAVPKVKNQLALKAALDVVYRGYVTPSTARQMRNAGVRVGSLPGAITKKDWVKRTRRQQRKASQNTARQYEQGLVY